MQEHDAARVLQCYGDMLYRICFVMLKNNADAEDALQEVLLKYLMQAPAFEHEGHEKAWLITVARNQCRNICRQRARAVPTENEEIRAQLPDAEDCRIMEALLQVPEAFRLVLTLHYIEGYKVQEIAHMIGKSNSAVKMRLAKGRRLLADIYGKGL